MELVRLVQDDFVNSECLIIGISSVLLVKLIFRLNTVGRVRIVRITQHILDQRRMYRFEWRILKGGRKFDRRNGTCVFV